MPIGISSGSLPDLRSIILLLVWFITSEYIEELEKQCIDLCASLKNNQQAPPPSLCSEYERPDKSIAVQRHKSRLIMILCYDNSYEELYPLYVDVGNILYFVTLSLIFNASPSTTL